MNKKISEKDKKNWQNFISNKEKLINKDLINDQLNKTILKCKAYKHLQKLEDEIQKLKHYQEKNDQKIKVFPKFFNLGKQLSADPFL